MPDPQARAEAQVVYRLAEEADLPRLAELYAKLSAFFRDYTFFFPEVDDVGQRWLESFQRTLGRFSAVYVAELDGQVVGFVLGRVKRVAPYLGGLMVGELSDIWVEPEARGLHAGERLTHLIVDWLRLQGAHSVETQVLFGNEPIWHLFEKAGFQPELRQMRLLFDEAPDA